MDLPTPAKDQPQRRPPTWRAPDQGLRLMDSRGRASHNATGVFAGDPAIAGYRFRALKVPLRGAAGRRGRKGRHISLNWSQWPRARLGRRIKAAPAGDVFRLQPRRGQDTFGGPALVHGKYA